MGPCFLVTFFSNSAHGYSVKNIASSFAIKKKKRERDWKIIGFIARVIIMSFITYLNLIKNEIFLPLKMGQILDLHL